MVLRATRFGDLRCSTLSWCRRTRISASNAARGRNSLIKAHQINLQMSLIGRSINRFAGASQPFWVYGTDSQTWAGRGMTPQWMREQIKAGRKPEQLLINKRKQ